MNPIVPILVVEDDDDDFFLTSRVLKKRNGQQTSIFRASSGHEAIDYLSGQNTYADRTRYPLPELVFLDLKMNDGNGFDVLEWLKTHSLSGNTKVYVLTGSDEKRDHDAVAQSQTALGYFVKPLSAQHLDTVFGN